MMLRRLFLPVLLVLPIAAVGQTAGPAMPWGGGTVPGQAAEGFGVATALFVTEGAQGYGMYQRRAGNRFKAGETLRFYVEPVNYGYKPVGEQHSFGATIDLRLTQDGNTVFGKDGFLNADFLSHHRNKEVNFTGSLDVSGAPAGSYRLELVVRDKVSGGVARAVLPFVIE